jgi:hypothetical protein
MQGHLSQERRYATPPFQGQQVPDRRRQVAHRGIQANAPGRIALRARFSAIRHVPSIYERYHEWDIENYYSILKRGITSVYHSVSEAHLHRYLAEFDFRYSNRSKLGVEDAERAARALKGAEGKRLQYRQPR